jgi:hypothetical protein
MEVSMSGILKIGSFAASLGSFAASLAPSIAVVLVAFLVLLSTLSSGCFLQLQPPARISTSLSPYAAEERMESAFRQYFIPISETRRNSRVSSGKFDPNLVFGSMILDRVTCGANPMADPATQPVPTELEVVALIRGGSQGTQVELESFGKGVAKDGEAVKCRLSGSFALSLLESVGTWSGRTGGASR